MVWVCMYLSSFFSNDLLLGALSKQVGFGPILGSPLGSILVGVSFNTILLTKYMRYAATK